MTERVDTLIRGWYVVTMNETRDLIRDGAAVADIGGAACVEAVATRKQLPTEKHSTSGVSPVLKPNSSPKSVALLLG